MQSDGVHRYAVHRHRVAALHSYIHTTWLRLWGTSVTCGFKMMSFYVMVEAERHLKLIPAFILDIYKVFEHIDTLFIGIG